ncbi:cytochrome-c peroxidase [Arcticibacterium luteifluviistationis]|uniref:Cytochrome-c peroxidase n=1 Tax=Arcticibacterium luteifluviistationis TaxID=1784714 RepID=A0A2Z4GG44_9BACT|nr:cytochrome c peroxidase [Arcticibacterium luteifluviistationis]AWW00038.1 cytochrome-c peroxidase [Arcticibacterium luteifluviistationis]
MNKRDILLKSSIVGLLFAFAMFFLWPDNPTALGDILSENPDAGFSLNKSCPPGFKLNGENECISQNLYLQYDSPNNKGLGGLQTGLPELREGFSPQEIDLGRLLFFDPVLSGNGTMSCATCHQPDKGFSDGMATGIGNGDLKLTRATPTLWNVGYLRKLFWDGRSDSLEQQIEGPLFAKEEMNNTPENLLKTINEIETYKILFAETFPQKDNPEIELDEIYTAITAFQSSLISLNSKYDKYAHGYHNALSSKEKEGMNIFRSFVARCAECHTPPLFTNQEFAIIGSPEPEGLPLDPGAQIPKNDSTLRGAFKVPSLRNIEKTAPYMHSGNFGTLRETVEFYTKGRGHAVPKGENLLIHWHIWEPDLSDYELDRLVDFLKTLTDESFTPKIPEKVPSGLKPSV